MLTDYEKRVIEDFAAGDRSKRDHAIKIFRAHLKEWFAVTGGDGEKVPHMGYMSERDSPVPCHVLSNRYKGLILGEPAAGGAT